jgi:hypothetical protein
MVPKKNHVLLDFFKKYTFFFSMIHADLLVEMKKVEKEETEGK